MNVKELIKKIEALPAENYKYRPWIDKKVVLGLVRQLDEPQKVVVPQFVAEYIKYTRSQDWDLQDAMDSDFIASEEDGNFSDWFYTDDNMELFARAWLDGYEKEKRYLVRIIGITNYNSYLNYHKGEDKWTIESRMEIDAIRTEHTRKELESNGFGWVFDCPGIEIEEVTE